MDSYILKGNIFYSAKPDEISINENSYVICENGCCRGVFKHIPKQYEKLKVYNYEDKLIIPGLVDLHIHAPQYAFKGIGMDMELLDWLDNQAFPEEIKYNNVDYAIKAYSIFSNDLKNSATAYASVFATIHRESTIVLMDLLEQTGLKTYVGKINMDRLAPDELTEKSADYSAFDTFGWINKTYNKYKNTKPILTPRFLPSCSDELLNELKQIKLTYDDFPLQSHLSENPNEVELVKILFPNSKFYADGYDHYSLFGTGNQKTIMAHCIYSTDEEIELIKKNGVFVAHCPASNMNLASGICPVRKFMDLGVNVGLGSDIAGGHSISIFRCITDAIQLSKLYWRIIDNNCKALTLDEAFYLATKGGGKFFGDVSSFEKGYEFSAVVIDDTNIENAFELNARQRLEKAIYSLLDSNCICAKFIADKKLI